MTSVSTLRKSAPARSMSVANRTPQRDITITAVNGHQFELPAAGGNGMQPAAIGMGFAVIGLFGLLYVQKEKF